jgi:hypothetical protein
LLLVRKGRLVGIAINLVWLIGTVFGLIARPLLLVLAFRVGLVRLPEIEIVVACGLRRAGTVSLPPKGRLALSFIMERPFMSG